MNVYQPLLQKLETVESLSDAERSAAVALCDDVRTIARHKDIVSEGDRPRHIHIILRGWAARYSIVPDGGRCITAFLLPGDFCDIHVTTLDVMDHSIIAITDCEVAFVPTDQIDEITRSTPVLTRALWRSTLIDESILRQWLVNSNRRDAVDTIGLLLCELYARLELVGLVNDNRLKLPLTQEHLGDATGLTAVHVNRKIRDLREQRLLTISDGELHLPDIPSLAKYCKFDPQYLHLKNRAPEHAPARRSETALDMRAATRSENM